jgi:hypothetical protein
MDSILENEMPEQFKEFVCLLKNELEISFMKIMLHHCLNFFDSYSIFIQIVKGGEQIGLFVLQGETSDVCGSRKKQNRVALETIPNIKNC